MGSLSIRHRDWHLDRSSVCRYRNRLELMAAAEQKQPAMSASDVVYVPWKDESQMPLVMGLIEKDLSEPYSIFTYRYFIINWPRLCFLEMHAGSGAMRGYIAMLAVDKSYRKLKIGTTLVRKAIEQMIEDGADEVVLECEETNKAALSLYHSLGFVRDKRLHKYYLSGSDAFRLKLWLTDKAVA